MKIFTTASVILISLLASTQIFAQNFYVDVNAGFALPLGGQVSGENGTGTLNEIDNSLTLSKESVNTSLGQGFNFGGNVGYKLNKYLRVELEINYLLGSPVKLDNTNIVIERHPLTGEETVTTSYMRTSQSSNMFHISPTLVITPGFEKLNPYAKFGFVMGFGTATTESEELNNQSYYLPPYSPELTQSTTVYSGGMGIGFKGSIGTEYILNEKLNLFAEVSFMSFSYAPKKSEITALTVNDKDELANLTIRQKEIEYLPSFTQESIYGPSDEPSKSTKISLPYNNIGLNLGLKYSF